MKKRQPGTKQLAQPADESAGQLLSPEQQEKASLKRIMSEMGHHGGRKAGHALGAKSAPPHRRKPARKGPPKSTKGRPTR